MNVFQARDLINESFVYWQPKQWQELTENDKGDDERNFNRKQGGCCLGP